MRASDLVRLQTELGTHLLEQWADQDPNRVAEVLRKSHPELASAVATQVALRQLAARKLPSWLAAGCLFLREALEQATPESIHSLRAIAPGALAVDLTAGLGSDTWALTRNSGEVIAVEPDSLRADLLRHNLSRLGCGAIAVHCLTAETWVAQNPQLRPDILLLDPARRSDIRRKSVALADCQPNVLELLPFLRRTGARILLKLSPLFDPMEAARLPDVIAVAAHSLEGEVKELWVELAPLPPNLGPTVSAKGIWQNAEWHVTGTPGALLPKAESARFLVLPDAAIEKMGLVEAFCRRWDISNPWLTNSRGYLLCDSLSTTALPARVLALEGRIPFKPRKVAAELHALGYGQAVVHSRNFPVSVPELRQRLRLAEGQALDSERFPRYVLATETASGKWLYLARRVA